LDKLPISSIKSLLGDLSESPALVSAILEKPALIDAWKKLSDMARIIPSALRKNPDFVKKFDDVANSNTLGLNADDIADLLRSPSAKRQAWDSPDAVLDAVKRVSDSGAEGVTVAHKKFPAPAEGNSSFVLDNAKQYQKEASGDAALSFEKNGVSFDNVTADGKLVDRKYGHGSSVFNADGSVKNEARSRSIINQGRSQVAAANETPIQWEVSTELGAEGIQDLFDAQTPPIDIEIIHVVQQIIIN
ncbi:MAG: hypothetical protein WBA74_20725, partial [Cyclobacteriaceae bacterium]